MAREDFDEGHRVHHPKTNRFGTVIKDWYGACLREEVCVLFDGEHRFIGIDWRELVKVDLAN